jgi:Mg2+-importing ATPase
VVFAIRTRRRFFRSRPHGFLVAMAFGSVSVAIVLPLLSVGQWFGFVAPPSLFFVYLIGATAIYLVLVEITKGLFYRHSVKQIEGR